jgi:hypothetical protein
METNFWEGINQADLRALINLNKIERDFALMAKFKARQSQHLMMIKERRLAR